MIGDGSGLTNVVGSGSGIVVLNSGSTVGTAGTVDFGDGLNVTPIQAGIVTVSSGVSTAEVRANTLVVSGVSTFAGTVNTASIVATGIDLNGDIDVDGHTNLDHVSIAGVTTFASAMNATTINATTFVGNGDFVELDVDGHTNLDNVSVAGVTTFTGAITAGDIRHDSPVSYTHLTLPTINWV